MTQAAHRPRMIALGTPSGTRGPWNLVDELGNTIWFEANADIDVYRYSTAGAKTLLTEGLDYTLTGGPSAGVLTLTTVQALLVTNERVVAERRQTYAQLLSLAYSSAFPALPVEQRFDVLVRMIQEIDDRAEQSLRLSRSDLATYELPPARNRGPADSLQYVLGFNPATGAPQLTNVTSTSLFGGDGDKVDLTVSSAGSVHTLKASAVLSKLLTVDGAGSGVDADLLDGQDASAFELATAFDVRRYGAFCNRRVVRDAAMTNGSAVLTSATATFSASDVGKLIGVQGAVPNAANGSTKPLVTTIASYQSATQVTLAAAATQTVSGAEAAWGTNDATAIQAAITACGAAGGGFVEITGNCVIGSTLDLSAVDGVVLRGNMMPHAVDSTGFNEDLPRSLSRLRTSLTWLGADGGYMVQQDIGTWEDGTYVKRQRNGVHTLPLDGFGRAAGVLRTFSTLAFDIDRITAARFTTYGVNFGVTTNRLAAAVWDNVASQQVKISRSVFVNRGSAVYGAKGLIIWGDKSDYRGNVNYYQVSDSTFLIENDASLDNIVIEQCDTTDFIGCTWNGRAVLHSAESAGASALSIFNGLSHLTELLVSAAAPVTETVRLPLGTYNFTATGGTNGTVTSSDVTLTGTTVSTGAAVSFTVGPGAEKLATTGAAGSESITLAVGTYVATASGAGATIRVAAGSATLVGAKTIGSISDVFEVTVAGTVTVTKVGSSSPAFSVKCISGNVLVTKNGAVTSWTLKIANRNSQARTVTFTSCSGIVVAKNAPTLGAGFHSQNHAIIGYDLENVGVLPIIEPGADIRVNTNASVGQAVGALDYGARFAGVKAKLAVNQSIPDSTWTSISWPTPQVNPLGMWAVGNPTRITKGHASNAADSNNVLDLDIDASVSFASSAVGYRFLAVLKNGTTRTVIADTVAVGGGNATVLSGFFTDEPAPGDYYEVQVFQSSGGALNAELGLTKVRARAY